MEKYEIRMGITCGVVVAILIAVLIGYIIGDGDSTKIWQKTITEKGFGGYNHQSGEWEWNK